VPPNCLKVYTDYNIWDFLCYEFVCSSAKWFTDVYIKPYARIQTYLIGIWLGWILYKTKGKKVTIPKPLVVVIYLAATATALSVLYGIFPYFEPDKEIPDVPRFLYAGFSRFAWATCVAWVIFSCVKGYGGPINAFLSWKIFIPLGRLGFCVFLVSLHLQMVLHLSFRQPITFENYSMVNTFACIINNEWG